MNSSQTAQIATKRRNGSIRKRKGRHGVIRRQSLPKRCIWSTSVFIYSFTIFPFPFSLAKMHSSKNNVGSTWVGGGSIVFSAPFTATPLPTPFLHIGNGQQAAKWLNDWPTPHRLFYFILRKKYRPGQITRTAPNYFLVERNRRNAFFGKGKVEENRQHFFYGLFFAGKMSKQLLVRFDIFRSKYGGFKNVVKSPKIFNKEMPVKLIYPQRQQLSGRWNFERY